MIDAVDLDAIENKKLQHYLYNYLSMMLCICSVFLRMEETPENEEKRKGLWVVSTRQANPRSYRQLRKTFLNLSHRICRRSWEGGLPFTGIASLNVYSSSISDRAGYSIVRD